MLKKQQADGDLPAVLLILSKKIEIDVFLDCIYKKNRVKSKIFIDRRKRRGYDKVNTKNKVGG